MSSLQESIVSHLTARGAMSEGALAGMHSGTHREILAGALRKLRAAGTIERSDSGYFTIAGTAQPEPKVEATETPKTAVKRVGRPAGKQAVQAGRVCGSCKQSRDAAAFTPSATICKSCKKAQNDAYAKKRAAKAGEAPAAPVKPAEKAPAEPVADRGFLMHRKEPAPVSDATTIVVHYTLRVADADGAIHSISVSLDTLKRLAAKLQGLA